MSAFRRFDPYATLARTQDGDDTANDANPAKVPVLLHTTLAPLASLAGGTPDPFVIAGSRAGAAKLPAPAEATPAPSMAPDADIPLLLRDGRRLRRLAAAAIVEDRSGRVKAFMQTARCYGAGLWADGNELIVVEEWGLLLPDDVLDQLRQHAGAVIAELRGESRARGDWQVFDPPQTDHLCR